jgi:nitrogen-specific signal transduction histidine kinase
MDSQINFSGWMENDYNPFIVFGSDGHIQYLNKTAEMMMGYIDKKEFFDLAMSYAPTSFGYKTSFLNLSFGKSNFFSITVGYEDEDTIGIKLYQNPGEKANRKRDILNYEMTNIYLLLELNMTIAKTQSKAEFKQEFDPSFPEFKISQNKFSTVLRKVYENFYSSKKVITSLSLKTGEYLKIEDKKYQIIQLVISGDVFDVTNLKIVEEIAGEININISNVDESKISIDIPMIS